MIRINLLAGERPGASKKKAVFGTGQKVLLACGFVLMLAVFFVSWRYLALGKESKQLDVDISIAQAETSRLHGIIQQVQQFEQRKTQLQQRVVLIEQLRKGQTGPVHMLDQISRALPPMVWLTDLKQAANDVTIDGRSTTQVSVSDFAANLVSSGYFGKSVEIVSTTTETTTTPPGQLIKFVIKGNFQPPGSPAPPGPDAKKAGR